MLSGEEKWRGAANNLCPILVDSDLASLKTSLRTKTPNLGFNSTSHWH